jgi:3',5'-cyclic AMP phosphodiesterase CpdA
LTRPFCFAVIADSHFRVHGDDPQSSHPSDAGHNDRNRRVVAHLLQIRPDWVVHLGDVPHPVPGLTAHAVALGIAKETYAPLGDIPLTVVPGNHDVGDKPRPWANAPGVGLDKHRVFQETWGAPWGSFDHHGVHFVWIDTPILNTGQPMEQAQWDWLEADLAAAAGRRCFAFVHYPPYLCEPHEPEHYDNLAEPGRSRLLGLLASHGVEALFAGHVHNAFFDRLGNMDLHVVPSTAFVRPEYAELATVGPGGEFGRDDPAKLGFVLVHVDDHGYRLEFVRSEDPLLAPLQTLHPAVLPGGGPTPQSPLGASLRHDWSLPREVPFGNLDEFSRKEARNDHLIVALWDLGMNRLRVPAADLAHPRRRARMEALAAHGARFVVFSAGLPDSVTAALVSGHPALLAGWEVIVPRSQLSQAHIVLSQIKTGTPIFLSTIGGHKAQDGHYFSHFPEHGFDPNEPELAAWHPLGLSFRVAHDALPLPALNAAASQVRSLGIQGLVRVQLPRAGEAVEFTDDRAIALRIAEATVAAWANRSLTVIVDTLVDHDRGYHPRHGLLDRRCNPRAAYPVLRYLARLLPTEPKAVTALESENERLLRIGDWAQLHLPHRIGPVQGNALDLVSGAQLAPNATCDGPWLELL